MKEGFWYKISLRVVPFVFVWVTRIWFGTCRVKTHGQEYRSQVDKCGGPVVASFWHYTILFIFYYMRRETGVAMVSASRDGEYISRIAPKEKAAKAGLKPGSQKLEDPGGPEHGSKVGGVSPTDVEKPPAFRACSSVCFEESVVR